MNKGGGVGLSGGGPTTAAAAAAAQKQKTLLQRVDTDITSIVDNFSHLVNVSRVNDPPVRNSQEAFMMEMRAARMLERLIYENASETETLRYESVRAKPSRSPKKRQRRVQSADSLLKLVSELKQTAIFSGLASLNEHVEQRTMEFNQQAEKTERILARIGEEAAGSLKELETHYYSSVQKIDPSDER